LLSVIRRPKDNDFEILRRVYDPGEPTISDSISRLRKIGLISKAPNRRVASSIARKHFSPTQLDFELPDIDVFRASLASMMLGVDLDQRTVASLADVTAAMSAIAARQLSDGIALDYSSPDRLLASSLSEISGISWSRGKPPRSFLKSPVMLDWLNQNAKAREPHKAVQALLNLRLSRTVDVRWRRLSEALLNTMALKPTPLTDRSQLATDLVEAVSKCARSSSTGWTLVFEVFQAFQIKHRLSLNDFKDAVLTLASANLLELGPLNVPLMIDDTARAKSSIVAGGLTYHLVRPSKQRARLKG